MYSVSVSELKETLSEVLNRAAYGRERIVIASRGRPKAAVIGLADLKLLEEWDATLEELALADAELPDLLRAREEARAGVGLTPAELREYLLLPQEDEDA